MRGIGGADSFFRSAAAFMPRQQPRGGKVRKAESTALDFAMQVESRLRRCAPPPCALPPTCGRDLLDLRLVGSELLEARGALSMERARSCALSRQLRESHRGGSRHQTSTRTGATKQSSPEGRDSYVDVDDDVEYEDEEGLTSVASRVRSCTISLVNERRLPRPTTDL